MADHRITDFVDPQAIASLKNLKDEIDSVKAAYIEAARELIKGLNMNVGSLDDLEKLTKLLGEGQRKASDSTERLTRAASEQGAVFGRTTAQIAESLQELNKHDRELRQSKVDHDQIREVLEKVNGTYDQRLKRLVDVEAEMKKNSAALKALDADYKNGVITAERYKNAVFAITKQQRELAQEKTKLNSALKNEEKEMNSVQGSYNHLSQQLEILKKAYKDLNDEEKSQQFGKDMLEAINQLDTELKHQAENMGEHQRNVGDYAIAIRDGVAANEDLERVLGIEAATIGGCIEQNKSLEQAKLNLNTADESYGETLDRINAKIEENRRRISDVDAIIGKQATSVAEAEAQNKQLEEALKTLDATSEGAAGRIELLNAKIRENKKFIEDVTPALQDADKASEGLVDQMASLLGVNAKFGSSLQSLGKSAESHGNMLDGLKIKTEAFGKTLIGLISNPMVLTFLGVVGVVAGAKWWYDYNKGLAEASRLTENFTGFAGKAADNVTNDMQTIADKTGKGYNDTISAANTLVQQFGIGWDEAYEKMKDGITAGADMGGNMIANIERFAPALRDAGVSADEFMAILSETRNGIFNEQGIQNIVKAGTRLRAMTKQTEESLDNVGISAKKMQSDLEGGNLSMMEAAQQVAAKLKELPENSQEAGEIMKNVFGRTAAEGGTLLIQSIADVNTNLEKAKENMGELGKINEEQMNAQHRLNELLNSVFKMSGTSFEQMTTKAKTFVTNGIIKIIEGCVGIVNWFIKLYNHSVAVRGSLNAISVTFKTIWDVCKFVVNQIIDSFKALGTVIEGVLTLDIDKIVSGYKKGLSALKANVADMVGSIISNTNDAIKNTIEDELKEITIDVKAEYNVNDEASSRPSNKNFGTAPENKKSDGKADKGTEKEAKEEINRINQLEEAKLAAMSDGHEKEIETIRHSYLKRIRQIQGDSEEEKQTRIDLYEAMYDEIAACIEKHDAEIAKTDYSNRLSSVEKGSREEYEIRRAMLSMERKEAIAEAEKKGADVQIVREKYLAEEAALAESFSQSEIQRVQNEYAVKSSISDNAMMELVVKRKEQYARELKTVGDSEEKRQRITKQYEADIAKITEDYAVETATRQCDMYEEVLQSADLTAADREAIERELAKARAAMEDAVADAAIAANERIAASDKEMNEKRMANAQQWMQVASEGLSAVNDLASAIFDAKIQRIEEEMEANEEQSAKETEAITEMVSKKVITEEEGEARKRAAEAKTAKRNEELEKKKQQLAHKQAVWDKANSLAQAGIATALAITQALPNVVLAAIAGAMGAIQMATIAATPIPKYAKGTESHKGGLAIVGDAGKAEVVSFGGVMYLTPDTPTIVDIPKGAAVYPDASEMAAQNLTPLAGAPTSAEPPSVVVNNDYRKLERKMEESNSLVRQLTRQQRTIAYRNAYQFYKLSRL